MIKKELSDDDKSKRLETYIRGTCWNCYLNEQVDIDLMEIYLSAQEQYPERIIVALTGKQTDVILVRTQKFFCKNCFQETYGFTYYIEKNGKYTEFNDGENNARK